MHAFDTHTRTHTHAHIPTQVDTQWHTCTGICFLLLLNTHTFKLFFPSLSFLHTHTHTHTHKACYCWEGWISVGVFQIKALVCVGPESSNTPSEEQEETKEEWREKERKSRGCGKEVNIHIFWFAQRHPRFFMVYIYIYIWMSGGCV